MAKFIKLTTITGFPIAINVDHITCISTAEHVDFDKKSRKWSSSTSTYTAIDTINSAETPYYIKEKFEYIIDALSN